MWARVLANPAFHDPFLRRCRTRRAGARRSGGSRATGRASGGSSGCTLGVTSAVHGRRLRRGSRGTVNRSLRRGTVGGGPRGGGEAGAAKHTPRKRHRTAGTGIHTGRKQKNMVNAMHMSATISAHRADILVPTAHVAGHRDTRRGWALRHSTRGAGSGGSRRQRRDVKRLQVNPRARGQRTRHLRVKDTLDSRRRLTGSRGRGLGNARARRTRARRREDRAILQAGTGKGNLGVSHCWKIENKIEVLHKRKQIKKE